MDRRSTGNKMQTIKDQHNDEHRIQGKLQMLPDTFIDRCAPGDQITFL